MLLELARWLQEFARLFALFDAGATLVLSQFHDMHQPLARYCRGLEQLFLHGVQANIYLTPPGAQGEQCALIQSIAAEDRPNVSLVVIVLTTPRT